MKTIILCLIVACCAPFASGCQTPAVKNAENAGLSAAEACAKVNIWQPVEAEGTALIAKVGGELLAAGAKPALDDGIAQVKAAIAALPSSVEPKAVDCAIKAAVAAYAAGTGQGFSGGNAQLSYATAIGKRLLVERGAQ